jgi:wyosine [tRNA(Phe)-imidazoG37] synthetase (radical SAM superfamily)
MNNAPSIETPESLTGPPTLHLAIGQAIEAYRLRRRPIFLIGTARNYP